MPEQNTKAGARIGAKLEIFAHLAGLCGSLWLIYYGLSTRSLWLVIGLFVGLVGLYNIGLFDYLEAYLEKRGRAREE
jgi:hypothetical protein